jgi:hypothetical protein
VPSTNYGKYGDLRDFLCAWSYYLFKSNVIPMLLYAAETWHLNQEQERKVLAFENSCLRRILNIHWSQKVTSQSILEMTQQTLITNIIRIRRWRYLDHVLHINDHRLPKAALHWQPPGTRSQGRPENTLHQTNQRDLRKLHTSVLPEWEDITAIANMREDWWLLLDALRPQEAQTGLRQGLRKYCLCKKLHV